MKLFGNHLINPALHFCPILSQASEFSPSVSDQAILKDLPARILFRLGTSRQFDTNQEHTNPAKVKYWSHSTPTHPHTQKSIHKNSENTKKTAFLRRSKKRCDFGRFFLCLCQNIQCSLPAVHGVRATVGSHGCTSCYDARRQVMLLHVNHQGPCQLPMASLVNDLHSRVVSNNLSLRNFLSKNNGNNSISSHGAEKDEMDWIQPKHNKAQSPTLPYSNSVKYSLKSYLQR